jgi:two-component system phosphate regulon sensor histidine kinase PhoR
MGLLRRFIFLLLSVSVLFAWAGGLEGPVAWLIRGLVLVAGAALTVHWVVVPWRELQAAVDRILNGDFSARLDDVDADVLSGPARSFNAMAEHLAQSLELAKQREDRLMAILSASDRGILVINREGEVTLASPVTQLLFPKFRPDAGLASLGLPGISQLAEEVFSEGLKKGKVLEEGERGRARVFAVQVAPLGREGVVIYIREVTSETRLERVKADLVANVSHELRTPLTALGVLSETLADEDLPEERRAHFLRRLELQIRRMQALVDDLLSLSRLESSQIQPLAEPVHLKDLCEEMTQALHPLAQEAAVALETRCPDDLWVLTDRVFLETALRNLIENAIRYNRPKGSVFLEVEGGPDSVRLAVRDTGEGIPGAHLGRIFERFYRVDPHRSREKGGTGLGLAIVKHAVSKLGGEVEVSSTVGVGSTFTITLPLRHADGTPLSHARASSPA